jgi:hypothetical protein
MIDQTLAPTVRETSLFMKSADWWMPPIAQGHAIGMSAFPL